MHPDIYASANMFGGKVISVDDLLGGDIDSNFVVLLIVHGIFKVEVLDFHFMVFCIEY